MAAKPRENLTRRTMRHPHYEAFFFDHHYDSSVRVHYHDRFYELYFFLSGDVVYQVGDEQYSMTPGTLLLIAPHVLHWPVFVREDTPYLRMFLWLDQAYVAGLSSADTDLEACFDARVFRPGIRLSADTLQACRGLMLRLLALKEQSRYGTDLYAKSLIIQIMLHVNLACRQQELGESVAVRRSDFVSGVLDYIHENIDRPMSLDTIAGAFFVSKGALARRFADQLGVTVYQYIVKRRMMVAQKLLREGMPATRVSLAVGYTDYSAFYKAFCKEFGSGPAALDR